MSVFKKQGDDKPEPQKKAEAEDKEKSARVPHDEGKARKQEDAASKEDIDDMERRRAEADAAINAVRVNPQAEPKESMRADPKAIPGSSEAPPRGDRDPDAPGDVGKVPRVVDPSFRAPRGLKRFKIRAESPDFNYQSKYVLAKDADSALEEFKKVTGLDRPVKALDEETGKLKDQDQVFQPFVKELID